MYYHLLILRRQFTSRAEGKLGSCNLPSLTTEEWRSVLGNTYWKSRWPRPNPGNAVSSNFDPAHFWAKGGPLFFGDELSAEVASGREVTSVLHCRCEVQMDSADDEEIRQTILYHLNMDHVLAEIKEMDRLQFPLNYERRWDQGWLSAILTPYHDGHVGPHQGWRGIVGLLRGQESMEGLAPSSM